MADNGLDRTLLEGFHLGLLISLCARRTGKEPWELLEEFSECRWTFGFEPDALVAIGGAVASDADEFIEVYRDLAARILQANSEQDDDETWF